MIVFSEEPTLKAIDAYVIEKLGHDVTGHGTDHIARVVRLAQHLATTESCDQELVSAGAYLHDIFDDKLVSDPAAATKDLQLFLTKLGWSPTKIDELLTLIDGVSFSGQLFQSPANTLPEPTIETKIVQDADRLDALGATGIARTFYYGGAKGHPLHDPTIPPIEAFQSKAHYRKGTTALNHFYEKLLRIQATLHTNEAKRIGQKRHDFMQQFLNQFLNEYAGQDF